MQERYRLYGNRVSAFQPYVCTNPRSLCGIRSTGPGCVPCPVRFAEHGEALKRRIQGRMGSDRKQATIP